MALANRVFLRYVIELPWTVETLGVNPLCMLKILSDIDSFWPRYHIL